VLIDRPSALFPVAEADGDRHLEPEGVGRGPVFDHRVAQILKGKPTVGDQIEADLRPDGKIAAAISIVVHRVIQLVVGRLLIKKAVDAEGDLPGKSMRAVEFPGELVSGLVAVRGIPEVNDVLQHGADFFSALQVRDPTNRCCGIVVLSDVENVGRAPASARKIEVSFVVEMPTPLGIRYSQWTDVYVADRKLREFTRRDMKFLVDKWNRNVAFHRSAEEMKAPVMVDFEGVREDAEFERNGRDCAVGGVRLIGGNEGGIFVEHGCAGRRVMPGMTVSTPMG